MFRAELAGAKEATAALNELGAKLAAKNLKGAVRRAIEEAEHKARARIPQGTVAHKTYRGRLVSPGFALSTLGVRTFLDKKTGAAVAILGVGAEAFYAVQFIEFGTSRMPAQPWLRPSFEESESKMLSDLAEELKKRVDRITRRRALKAAA